jgi:Fe-S cluster biogenesis protein NfuA
MSDQAPEAALLEQRVNEVIDSIRPYIQNDGGDIQLVAIEDGVVKLRLQGACAHCPSAIHTLKLGVERHLKERVPEIKGVERVA